MLALLGFLAIIAFVSASTCPPQYQWMENKCIRPLIIDQQFVISTDLREARYQCNKAGARLPVIKNDEENERFNRIGNSFASFHGQELWLVLDLDCNHTSRRFEWIDGTNVTYSPGNSVDFSKDCGDTGSIPISQVADNNWILVRTNDHNTKTVLCVIELDEQPLNEQCGEYELLENPTDSSKPCFKVFTEPLSWKNAQEQCAADYGSLVTINSAEENKYFWRSAISNNLIDGMHIGAHQSTANPTVWTWVDGEVPFGGKTYDNFISVFPIPGAGECGTMATESPSAQWVNDDCDDTALPYICRRSDFSALPKECPKDARNPGEDIFSPGFPNALVPCEYFLVVEAQKLVELEVMTLVADESKDFFEIFEGSAGPNLIANLTGTITTSTKFQTEKSNVMRVNWLPTGAGSGRGFRIRYNEIEP